MIEFKHVSKTYEDSRHSALEDISLKIGAGELMTIVGPSGSGKTTALKMINRLIQPSAGTIEIMGKDIGVYPVHQLRMNIGYVLQQIALFPHMTIEENIKIVPELKKWDKRQMDSKVDKMMELIGLDASEYLNRYPRELSGGEQQRIGIVRALAADPNIILMDEPFSALDPITRSNLQKDIQKLQKEIHKTIVFVTHDMEEAKLLGDRICLMNKGKVIQVDTPHDMVHAPKNEFVERFFGKETSVWDTPVGQMVPEEEATKNSMTYWYENIRYDIVLDEDSRLIKLLKNGKAEETPTLGHHIPLREAVDIMSEKKAHFCPVVKEGRYQGLIDDQKIIRYLKEAEQNRTKGDL